VFNKICEVVFVKIVTPYHLLTQLFFFDTKLYANTFSIFSLSNLLRLINSIKYFYVYLPIKSILTILLKPLYSKLFQHNSLNHN